MFTKASQTVAELALPLRRLPDPRAPNTVVAKEPGSRREQLRRQRERIQEYLETLERVTAERDEAREHNAALSDLADRMLTQAENAQNRVLELEHKLTEREGLLMDLSRENEALLEQGMRQASQIDLLETRLRVLLEE